MWFNVNPRIWTVSYKQYFALMSFLHSHFICPFSAHQSYLCTCTQPHCKMASVDIHKVKQQCVINILVKAGSKLAELHQGLEQYSSRIMHCQKHSDIRMGYCTDVNSNVTRICTYQSNMQTITSVRSLFQTTNTFQ